MRRDSRDTATGPTSDQPSAAGRSAQREYQRRRRARQARLRARYGVIGSAVAAVAGQPHHLSAWQQGAEGELETARRLETHLARAGVVLLHDRRMPGRGRANIDHVAIGPAGVTVIDTKSTPGHVELATIGVVRRREVLLVNGRDRTAELDRVVRQLNKVTQTLDQIGVSAVDVLGALCFPYMRRTWLHRSRARGGLIIVDDPRHIAKLARRRGALSEDEITHLAHVLAATFPPAAR